MEMLLFAIAALRAIIEMLGLCLIGQGALFAIAGRNSEKNPIYAMFHLITEMPVRLFAHLLPAASASWLKNLFAFVMLFVLWIGLAILRKFV